MGNGASIPFEGNSKQTALLWNKLTRGCDLFIQDEEFRQAYLQFLLREDHLSLLEQQQQQQQQRQQQLTDGEKTFEEVQDSCQSLSLSQNQSKFNDYLLPSGMESTTVESLLNANRQHRKGNGKEEGDEVVTANETCFSASQLKVVLLASMFPIFLESPEYNECKFRALYGDFGGNSSGELKKKGYSSKKEGQFRSSLEAAVVDALATTNLDELNRMLMEGNWLSKLKNAVEDLPICISLATASQDQRGFPLVYVNKAFERVTMYNRNDIIGRNCSFLQNDKTEPDQIKILVDGLRFAKPVKVVLTNARKDGSEFINLFAMKPVFDAQGVYSYVVGVQCDISDSNVSVSKFKEIDDLLALLPNVLN